jgi:PAS domain S-box-containing protein
MNLTAPAEPEPGTDSPVRVLVLEDDEAHTELIQFAFEHEPDRFQVTYTGTVREAREAIGKISPDVIIADWKLPDGNGIDILPRKAGHVTTPVIIMTSHGSERLAVELMKSGAIEYLVKSEFSFSELPHTIQRVIREWNLIRDRSEAEEALLLQRETLASILDAITESVYLVTPEGTFLEANDTAAHRFGRRDRTDLIGKNLWEVLPPDLAESRKQKIATVIETGRPVLFEGVLEGRDNSLTLFPVKDAGRNVTRIAVFDADITDRKRAEEAVDRINKCLLGFGTDFSDNVQQVVELCGELTDASFVLYNRIDGDRISIFSKWNAPEGIPVTLPVAECLCYEVCRQDREQLLLEDLQNSPLAETCPGIRNLGIVACLSQVVRHQGMPVGTLCILFTRPPVSPERYRNPLGILATAISAEENRRIYEDSFIESEERFRAQYQNNPLAIFTWQKSGNDFILIECNQAALDLTDGAAAQFLGKTALELYRDRPDIVNDLRNCFNNRTTMVRENSSYHFLPGQYIRTTAAYVPPDMILVHMEDITDRKNHEDTLNLANAIFQSSYLTRNLESSLGDAVRLIGEYTGCDSVGIRVLGSGGSIPYMAYQGFSEDFYEKESPLSINSDECMCINVIRGTTDPRLPFYTAAGSFFMNGTTKFLSTVSEEDKGRTRNICNKVGYESVALIPVRDNERIIGLIHLADHRENLVPIQKVRVMENIGITLGEVIQRLRFEAALHDSEDRFRNLADLLPTVIFEAGPDGVLTFANRAAFTTFGILSEELQNGLNFRQFIAPGELARAGGRWQEIISAGASYQPSNEEYIFMRKDGSFFPAIITNTPIIRNGHVTGVRGTILDISRLRESEKRLAYALEASKSGTWDWDMVTDILHWSPELFILFGLPPDSAATFDTWLGVIHPEDQPGARVMVYSSIEDHIPLHNEYRVLLPGGRQRWIGAEGTTTYDSAGKPVRMSGICIDITERKTAEAALEQARKKLNLLNTVTFQDIQSLIFSTTAYINLTKTTKAPEKIVEYLEREAELVRQISQCLDFTKNYQDLGMVPARWQNVKDVFIYAISHLDLTSISRTIALDGLEIYADPLLEKAFMHILQNILVHGKNATRVDIRYEVSPTGTTLFIEDDGVGVPEGNKDIIFERSFGRQKELGLFLVREVLSITGITIRETGMPGEGARFELFIPANASRFKPHTADDSRAA